MISDKKHIKFGGRNSGIEWRYPCVYNGEYLENLRTADSFVAEISKKDSPGEIASKLRVYVNGLWKHDGMNEPEKSDPLTIIKEARNGRHFRCVEYSIVLDGFLKSLGIPSRILALKTKDCETRLSGAGHVAVEYYDIIFNKWVMADAQFSFIPVLNDIPLNAVELQNSLTKDALPDNMNLTEEGKNNEYFDFVYEYLYYMSFKIEVSRRKEFSHLMLVPEGSNKPEIFQQKYPITGHIPTCNIEEFYKLPLIR